MPNIDIFSNISEISSSDNISVSYYEESLTGSTALMFEVSGNGIVKCKLSKNLDLSWYKYSNASGHGRAIQDIRFWVKADLEGRDYLDVIFQPTGFGFPVKLPENTSDWRFRIYSLSGIGDYGSNVEEVWFVFKNISENKYVVIDNFICVAEDFLRDLDISFVEKLGGHSPKLGLFESEAFCQGRNIPIRLGFPEPEVGTTSQIKEEVDDIFPLFTIQRVDIENDFESRETGRYYQEDDGNYVYIWRKKDPLIVIYQIDLLSLREFETGLMIDYLEDKMSYVGMFWNNGIGCEYHRVGYTDNTAIAVRGYRHTFTYEVLCAANIGIPKVYKAVEDINLLINKR